MYTCDKNLKNRLPVYKSDKNYEKFLDLLLYEEHYMNTVIIAKVREVRENIKRNRLIWRIIQLWCFHHCHIVISHNSI